MSAAEITIQVLDHGYVKLIHTWGSDENIVESARMSTDGAFRGWGPRHSTACFAAMTERRQECSCNFNTQGDEKLLRYLYEHNHATPFEQAGMSIEVQAPIFVFREWHRHRTQSYNELSARYVPVPEVNYMPTAERIATGAAAAGSNKQAQGVADLSVRDIRAWRRRVEVAYAYAQDVYAEGLKIGIPKEVSRVVMPVGRYSRMRASANLRNWLAFLRLRQSPDAQWEIRQYANVVSELVANHFPRTWQLFDEEQRKGAR